MRLRIRIRWLFMVAIALCLFAGPAWAGNKTPSDKNATRQPRTSPSVDKTQSGEKGQSLALGEEFGNDLSLEELDRMQSRIKVLQKKIKIQGLKNKLEKKKSSGDEGKEEKKGGKPPKKELLKKLSGAKPSGGSPGGGAPGALGKQEPPPSKPKAFGMSRPGKQQGGGPQSSGSSAAQKARVTSVTGFGKDVRAKVKLSEGGEISVSEGDETRIGTVESVSVNGVIVKSDGKKHRVPFASRLGDPRQLGEGFPLRDSEDTSPAPIR